MLQLDCTLIRHVPGWDLQAMTGAKTQGELAAVDERTGLIFGPTITFITFTR
jgi:hypothetical protein